MRDTYTFSGHSLYRRNFDRMSIIYSQHSHSRTIIGRYIYSALLTTVAIHYTQRFIRCIPVIIFHSLYHSTLYRIIHYRGTRVRTCNRDVLYLTFSRRFQKFQSYYTIATFDDQRVYPPPIVHISDIYVIVTRDDCDDFDDD